MRKQHEYMRRLYIAVGNGLIDEGSAAMAQVCHDDNCKFFAGGACGCDPEIKVITQEGVNYITADGLISDAH